MKPEHDVVLDTERLRLVPVAHEHAAELAAVIGHPAISETTSHIPYPYTERDAHDFVDKVRSSDGGLTAWLVFDRAHGVLVGGCGLHGFEDGGCLFGYWVGVEHWGCGIATESMGRLLDYAFGALGLERAGACYFVKNPASRRVMEKLGLQGVPGQGRETCATCVDGREEPIAWMSITREAWLGRG